jgi:hypothetical protein
MTLEQFLSAVGVILTAFAIGYAIGCNQKTQK